MNYLKKGAVLSSILLLAACSSKIKNETVSEVAEVNEEEQLTFEMPRMSGQEYKAIDEVPQTIEVCTRSRSKSSEER